MKKVIWIIIGTLSALQSGQLFATCYGEGFQQFSEVLVCNGKDLVVWESAEGYACGLYKRYYIRLNDNRIRQFFKSQGTRFSDAEYGNAAVTADLDKGTFFGRTEIDYYPAAPAIYPYSLTFDGRGAKLEISNSQGKTSNWYFENCERRAVTYP